MTEIGPMAAPACDQRVQSVGEAERDPFQHRLTDRRRVAVVGEAEQHPARPWIVVRRPLAGEIGQEDLRPVEPPASLDLGQQRAGVRAHQ